MKFIKELEKELKGCPDADEVLQDYKDHIKEGKKKGRKEAEIVKKLGSPKALAKQIRAEAKIEKAKKKPTVNNVLRAVFASAGLGFLNLIFILGPFLGLVGVLIGFYGAAVGLSVGGLGALIMSALGGITGFPIVGGIFISISLMCFGILLFILSIYLTKWLFKGLFAYLKWNVSIIKGGAK